MSSQRLRVFAPATIANIGPGFDVLGLALCSPGDVLEVELADVPGVEIVEITGDGGRLTRDPMKNVASRAAVDLLRRAGSAVGLRSVVAQANAAGERTWELWRQQRGRRIRGERDPWSAVLYARRGPQRHRRRMRGIGNTPCRQRRAKRDGRVRPGAQRRAL